MTIPRLLLVVGALVFLIIAAGCASSTSASQAAPKATPVDTSAPDLTVKVHAIELYTSTTEYQQPTAGYRFVLVDFSVTNAGLRGGYSYNPGHMTIRDPDNYQYGYHRVSYLIPGAFETTTIPLGETRRGKLVFEVPEKNGVGTVYHVDIEP